MIRVIQELTDNGYTDEQIKIMINHLRNQQLIFFNKYDGIIKCSKCNRVRTKNLCVKQCNHIFCNDCSFIILQRKICPRCYQPI